MVKITGSHGNNMTGFFRKSVVTGLMPLLMLLSACELLREEPTNMAVTMVQTLINMEDTDYAIRRNALSMREQLAIDYLRALRIQNDNLKYGVESVHRKHKDNRTVVVNVVERTSAGGRPVRAQFEVIVTRNEKRAWKVTSFRLVE